MLYADGGTVLFHKQAGPFEVTLFGSPTPLRVGSADLSVMVQKTADSSSVSDAEVNVHLKRSEPGNIVEVIAPATHAKATNKLLYAAHVHLPAAGTWRVDVEVAAAGSTASASGQVTVQPPEPPAANYWGYFALVPFVILLFVFNRWLKRRRRMTYPRVQR